MLRRVVLPDPFGTDQADDLAVLQRKGNILQRPHAAEGFRHAFDREERRHLPRAVPWVAGGAAV